MEEKTQEAIDLERLDQSLDDFIECDIEECDHRAAWHSHRLCCQMDEFLCETHMHSLRQYFLGLALQGYPWQCRNYPGVRFNPMQILVPTRIH